MNEGSPSYRDGVPLDPVPLAPVPPSAPVPPRKKRSLTKRGLESGLVLALTAMLVRWYRVIWFSTLLWKQDPRLVAWLRTKKPAVFVCWHQDFALTMGYLARFGARRPTYVLASASRDGGIAAAAAEAVGFRKAVRGSSASKGGGALLRMTRLGRSQAAPSLAVVGDGPRPPARILKPGALLMARESGAPIWLVRTAWHPERSLRRSWARFHWPLPWARGVIVADGPIEVPSALDREGIESMREALSARLNALADHADRLAERVWGSRS